MTAAHLPGAILTPRYRGARAVASFTKPDATQAAKRSATASPSSYREAATPNGDPAGRLGDGIVRPAFVAHLATRGCDKEARVAPAIRGANSRAFRCRSLPLAAAFFFACPWVGIFLPACGNQWRSGFPLMTTQLALSFDPGPSKFLPDAGTAQAAAIEQLAAFTAQFPQIVAQLGLGKRK